jgi:hypothetical protein
MCLELRHGHLLSLIEINFIFIINRYYFASPRIDCMHFQIEVIFFGQIFIIVLQFFIILKEFISLIYLATHSAL